MGFIFPRGRTLYIEYKVGSRTQQKSTGIRVGEKNAKKRAAQVLKLVEARAQAEATLVGDELGGAVTLARWAKVWIKKREAKGVSTWNDDESRVRVHVLDVLGDQKLSDLRAKHIEALIVALKKKPCQRDGTPLAPRTVRHVYTTLRALFRDAIREELIDTNPCDGVDTRYTLPPKCDKDPEWRIHAHFDNDEIVRLLTDERIPWDRRAFYALEFLAGVRFGEAAGLAWRHYGTAANGLGYLLVARAYSTRHKTLGLTKTGVTRVHPVHDALARFLDEWRRVGWPLFFGSAPEPDDLIVPSRRGVPRSNNHMKRCFDEDLRRLGMRKRRQHDSRKTWITRLVADGANEAIITRITHARPTTVIAGYLERTSSPRRS